MQFQHIASYVTHFIINQLAEEIKGELNCIGENWKKNISLFLCHLWKKRNDGKTITHKLRFIDSFRFMTASLLDLVDDLSGRIFNSIVFTKCVERKKLTQNASLIS